MSLILDALRKSEAERQRGQAPGLFTSAPMPATVRQHRLRHGWAWPGIALLVIIAGLVVWPARETARPPPAETAAGVVLPQTAPAVAAIPDPPIGTRAVPDRLLSVTGPSRPPAKVRPTPAAPPIAIATAPPLPPVPPAAASQEPPGRDTAVESLPPIAILGASERAALPPLKLSMHVWNSEPSKRFAIIDGQRVTEGSLVGNSSIDQIRRDGVVLNIDGRRILLPRP